MSVVVKLSKPVTEGETSLAELTLREPTLDDIAALGYPYVALNTESGAAIQVLPAVVIKYVSRLAAVPPSTVKQLSLQDFSAVQNAVIGFLGE